MPRNSDPLFWPSTEIDLSLRQGMHRNYTDCINILQTQWYQADTDQRFAMGDAEIWGLLYPGVATYRKKIWNFNIINSHIQMVSGYQRRNRKSSVCMPMHPNAQKTSDQFSKCLYYMHNRGNFYNVYSDTFEQGALTQGLGFTYFVKNTTCDIISGELDARYVDMKSCLFDPYFRRHDMMDARFWWVRTFYDRYEAARMYPEYEDQILGLPKGTYRDDKFYYMPEVYQIQFPNLIAFDEYWYLSDREATFMIDKKTEEVQEFVGDEEDARIIKMNFGDQIKFINRRKPTVRRTIVVNDKVFVDEPDPYHTDKYPVVPCLAYFNADTPYYAYKFRGITRDLRDSQYLFNRIKVYANDVIEAQQQGLKVKKGALVTPDDSLNSSNGRVLTIDGSFSMDDVQPMPIVPPPPIMLEMEERYKQVMNLISGVNETMLGTEINDKAGIIAMMRTTAGVTTLTKLFDNFDEYQKLCGDYQVAWIQGNWTYGKVKLIIGEEPTAEFDNKAFYKYGCKLKQEALTESLQQLELGKILHLREIIGENFPEDEIIEAMDIPNKDRIIEKIKATKEAQQKIAEEAHQMQMKQFEVDNQTKISYAHSQEGLAAERMAKIQLDKALNAERLQRAEEDKTAAVLNLVKAVKEIQGMDLNMFLQGIEMVKSLEEAESNKAQANQTSNQEVVNG